MESLGFSSATWSIAFSGGSVPGRSSCDLAVPGVVWVASKWAVWGGVALNILTWSFVRGESVFSAEVIGL